MEPGQYIALEDRGLLAVSGPDARSFLQPLVSNDIEKVSAATAIYATLLTPQGKFLHDFFICAIGDTLLFDCEAARIDDLQRRLTFYRLRADAKIENWSECYRVFALIGAGSPPVAGGVVYADPRLGAMGARAILPRDGAVAALEAAGLTAAPAEDYERLRLAHGLPDGSRDIQVEKGFLLENGIDDLHGVDFEKGCYIGQELTARTKHRATIRKRLLRVDIDGPLPPPGAPIMLGDKQAGEMRSGLDRTGLALLRLEMIDQAASTGEPLTCADATLTPVKPDWARF
jgi:folate-binding protein YgfZ